jgi:hypothetical protein
MLKIYWTLNDLNQVHKRFDTVKRFDTIKIEKKRSNTNEKRKWPRNSVWKLTVEYYIEIWTIQTFAQKKKTKHQREKRKWSDASTAARSHWQDDDLEKIAGSDRPKVYINQLVGPGRRIIIKSAQWCLAPGSATINHPTVAPNVIKPSNYLPSPLFFHLVWPTCIRIPSTEGKRAVSRSGKTAHKNVQVQQFPLLIPPVTRLSASWSSLFFFFCEQFPTLTVLVKTRLEGSSSSVCSFRRCQMISRA